MLHVSAAETRLPSPAARRRTVKLLRLSPGGSVEPLHGVLETHELDEAPPFDALLYTYPMDDNDDVRDRAIFLGPDWTIFPVTNHCEASLANIRMGTQTRLVWVDSIGAGEDNATAELCRPYFLRSIYEKAQRVLIYLCPSNGCRDTKS